MKSLVNIALASSLLLTAPLDAQTSTPSTGAPVFAFTRIAAPAEPDAIALYPDETPGSKGGDATEVWDRMSSGQRIVRNVTRPTITPFLPEPSKATGAAVIVAPGGAFKMLSMDSEGWDVAKWLAQHGVAAFVLKYRLNETPQDEAAFLQEMAKLAGRRDTGGGPPLEEPRATADAQEALRSVRSNAAKWKIDPARVGMIGFSAGAMTALNAALAANDQPAFFGYIYGPMTAITVPDKAPPMFAALAIDDNPFGRQGFAIVESWRKAGRPVELHAYERGGHGFGMGIAGTTTTQLMDEFLVWMKSRGLLTR